jgi:hypothetical protein
VATAQLRFWMECIMQRAPHAACIVVGTHCHSVDLPISLDRLKRQVERINLLYPSKVTASFAIDSHTDSGIEDVFLCLSECAEEIKTVHSHIHTQAHIHTHTHTHTHTYTHIYTHTHTHTFAFPLSSFSLFSLDILPLICNLGQYFNNPSFRSIKSPSSSSLSDRVFSTIDPL